MSSITKITAKKSLGQNFLTSNPILEAIIEAGKVQNNDNILEIGPGEGNLTEKLLKNAKKVIAVEKDDRLIPILEEKFKKEIEEGKLEIIHEDVLNFSIEKSSFSKKPYKIIANIPYYITGQFLKKFLEEEHKPNLMVLMLQKEVALRIIDEKGSILSVSVKAFGKPKYIKTVKKGSFRPQPKVDSAILLIDEISGELFEEIDQRFFFSLLKKGFGQKRKKLLNNLKDFGSKKEREEAFKEYGLSLNVRAEELKLTDWQSLTKKLQLLR